MIKLCSTRVRCCGGPVFTQVQRDSSYNEPNTTERIMSEQEKQIAANVSGSSPLVMVEQSSGSRYKHPYRPTELQEETPPDLHKRSKAPAAPSVTEPLKTLSVELSHMVNEQKDSESPITTKPSEKHSKTISKKASSKQHEFLSEKKTVAPSHIQTKKDSSPSVQPIPAVIETPSAQAAVAALKQEVRRDSEDDITHELAESTSEQAKTIEWSEDEEAGGLPRSASRASRVSRAVRQLLCCGVAYHPPSEEDISTTRYSYDKRKYKTVSVVYISESSPIALVVLVSVPVFPNILDQKPSLGPLLKPCGTSGLQHASGILLRVPKKTISDQQCYDVKPSGFSIKICKKESRLVVSHTDNNSNSKQET